MKNISYKSFEEILNRLVNEAAFEEIFNRLVNEAALDEKQEEIDVDIDVDLLAAKIDCEQKKEEKDIEVPQEIYNEVDSIYTQGIEEKSIRKLSIIDNLQRFIGFFSWENIDYSGLFLHDVYLHKQYRGIGVGRKIVNALIKVLKPIYVKANVVTESRGFFRKLGWSRINDPYMHYSAVAEAKSYNESNNGFELCFSSSSGNKYYSLDLDCDYKIKSPFKLIINRPDVSFFSLLYDGNNFLSKIFNSNSKLKYFFNGHNMFNGNRGFCVIYDLKDQVKGYISESLQAEDQKEESSYLPSYRSDSLQNHITPVVLSDNSKRPRDIESSDAKVVKKHCR